MDLRDIAFIKTKKDPEGMKQEKALSDKETYSRKNSAQIYEFEDIKTINTEQD